jgi:tetratricopeptide (TPR) repeat protein
MRALFTVLLIFSFLFVNGCGSGDKKDVLQEKSDAELLQMAQNEFDLGHYDNAMKLYEAVEKYYPNTDYYVEVSIGKANVLGRKEKYEEQLELYLKTLKANVMPQKVPRIYTEIGNFYQKFAPYDPGLSGGGLEEDYKKAIYYYKKAIEYDESNDNLAKSEAMANIGLVYAKMGETQKAVETYQKVLKIYPDTPFRYTLQLRVNNPGDLSPIYEITKQKYAEITGIEMEEEATEPEVKEEAEESKEVEELPINETPQDSTGNAP